MSGELHSWLRKLLPTGGLALLLGLWNVVPESRQEQFVDWVVTRLWSAPAHTPAPPPSETKTSPASVAPTQTPWDAARAARHGCDREETSRQLQLALAAAGSDETRAQVMIEQADLAIYADKGAEPAVDLLRHACELPGISSATRTNGLVRLGFAYLSQRDRENAQQQFQHVLAESEAPPLTAARARMGLAAIAMQRDAFDRASDELARSQAVLNAREDPAGLAELYLQLGTLQRMQDNLKLAGQSFQRALETLQADPCGDPKQAFALSALGDIERAGDPDSDRARDYYRQAYDHAVAHSFPLEKARALMGLSTFDERSGALDAARGKILGALGIYETYRALLQQAWAHERLSVVCGKERDRACAQQHSDHAARIERELHVDAANGG